VTAPRHQALLSWVLLLIVDLTIAWGGFPRLHRLIRGVRVRRRRTPPDDAAIVLAVNDAIDSAAIWYPRTVQCLPRSAVATWLLRRRGVAAVMVIGVRKMPFYAHAWVEVDGRVVNDVPKVQTLYPAIDRLVPREAVR
jgi:hypothetical protein